MSHTTTAFHPCSHGNLHTFTIYNDKFLPFQDYRMCVFVFIQHKNTTDAEGCRGKMSLPQVRIHVGPNQRYFDALVVMLLCSLTGNMPTEPVLCTCS